MEEEGNGLPSSGRIARAKRIQSWKSLVIEGRARSSVGKSAGLCGHVTCSGTRLFQEQSRKAREAARLCCNTLQQTTTGPVHMLQAFFFLGQSLGNSQFHSSNGNLAGPTHSLRKPLPSLHLPYSAFGNTCACNFPKYCCPSEFKDNMGYGCRHLGVG